MSWLFEALDFFASLIDAATGAVVAVGVVALAFEAVRSLAAKGSSPVTFDGRMSAARIRLGQWLALALELALAADIVRSVVAPTWDEIGKLAAIAALRTLLNFFLEREIERGSTPVVPAAL
jgi:uncharacterized membrane protein